MCSEDSKCDVFVRMELCVCRYHVCVCIVCMYVRTYYISVCICMCVYCVYVRMYYISVCMYMYVCVYSVYVRMYYIYIYIYIYICMHACMYVRTYVCVGFRYACACRYVSMYVCIVCVCVRKYYISVCIYVCTYVYVCMYVRVYCVCVFMCYISVHITYGQSNSVLMSPNGPTDRPTNYTVPLPTSVAISQLYGKTEGKLSQHEIQASSHVS